MHAMSLSEFAQAAARFRRPYHSNYYAMYSSLWQSIVTEPLLMMVPLDDHMVHRGDGVFEAFKCIDGAVYNLDVHLRRLCDSAAGLRIRLPIPMPELVDLTCRTVRAGGRRDCVVRVFLARGPGGFAARPSECPEPQIYIVATHLPTPFMEAHPGGARIATSRIPVKPAVFAVVKNCNYLPNVLMKQEAEDEKVDFTVNFDEHGHLGEGATENVGVVTADKRLLFPRLENILKGTTMIRLAELAEDLVREGALSEVAFADVPRPEVERAAEILIMGTTIDVVAAVEFDGRPVGAGKPGPIYSRLAALLSTDIRGNASRRTPAFVRA